MQKKYFSRENPSSPARSESRGDARPSSRPARDSGDRPARPRADSRDSRDFRPAAPRPARDGDSRSRDARPARDGEREFRPAAPRARDGEREFRPAAPRARDGERDFRPAAPRARDSDGRPVARDDRREGGEGRRFRSGPPAGGESRYGNSNGGGNSYRGGNGGNSGGRGQSSSRRRGPMPAKLDIAQFVRKAQATVKQPTYQPQHMFADFQIVDHLKRNIIEKGYVAPTPIQDQSIPHILAGKDLVGIANTGTGKTAAFLIPLINKVLANPEEKVLIVVPTRELANQIDDELRDFTKGTRLYSVICVGGANIGQQIRRLRTPHNFVVGTPGRLMDLVQRNILDLGSIRNIVLDEADRMLDMGFIADIKFIVSQMPTPRHTLFFSATMSSEIDSLIKNFLRDPVRISVKTRDSSENVDQDVVHVPHRGKKLELLHDLLIRPDFKKVLIFGRTKHGVERLSEMLLERGFKADSIHGDKNQAKRQRALNLFKDDAVQVLVATDVAARGLDIDSVSHVINYDMPATMEDYIHRIGRTGRGDMRGVAITFIEQGGASSGY